jgi:hypothetical protein
MLFIFPPAHVAPHFRIDSQRRKFSDSIHLNYINPVEELQEGGSVNPQAILAFF